MLVLVQHLQGIPIRPNSYRATVDKVQQVTEDFAEQEEEIEHLRAELEHTRLLLADAQQRLQVFENAIAQVTNPNSSMDPVKKEQTNLNRWKRYCFAF